MGVMHKSVYHLGDVVTNWSIHLRISPKNRFDLVLVLVDLLPAPNGSGQTLLVSETPEETHV